MSKSVKETLEAITPEKGTARFSKKNFNELLSALVNDTEFATKVAVTKNKELVEVKDVFIAKEFRKFLKKQLEKAGVDKADAQAVMDPSFEIDNVDGLYELIATSIYEYIDAHNRFEFLPKEDFRGSIALAQKDKTVKESHVRNPKTGEDMGIWETTTKPYKVLTASSPAPDYLKTRKKKG
jgi:hypothetical protein